MSPSALADRFENPRQNQPSPVALIDWSLLASNYQIVPAEAAPEIDVYAFRQVTKDALGYGYDAIADWTPFIKGSQYHAPDGRFQIQIPHFKSGRIEIHQRALRGGADLQVRFYERGESHEPAHAVVLTTLIPPDQKVTEKFVLDWAEGQQKQNTAHLRPGSFQVSRIEGPWSTMVQTVVINREATHEYPAARAQVSATSKEIRRLGVNRIFFKESMMVEVGILIGKPTEMDNASFLQYAQAQMDQFMSTLKLAEMSASE